MTLTQTQDGVDEAWIDRVVEGGAVLRLEVETWVWRLCGLIAETVVIAVAIFVAQTTSGTAIVEAIDSVTLIAFFFLLGRAVLLMIADFINNRLARLIRWWRRR